MATIALQRRIPAFLNTKLGQSLTVALLCALAWWLVALSVRSLDLIPVWYDQQTTFTRLGLSISDPYPVRNFMSAPWASILLIPFAFIPLEAAVLIQLALYYMLLAALIVRFGGGLRHTLIALTSFIAFDSALELNIEWLLVIGLLVPVRWSAPLLLVKPQVLLGYYFSQRPRDLLQAALVGAGVLLLSLLLWGWWPPQMLANIRTVSPATTAHNLAPITLLPVPISILIGVGLAAWAYRKRDVLAGIAAWYFFVPYMTLYSLLILFALLAARWPRIALLVSVSMWLAYGGTLVFLLLRS